MQKNLNTDFDIDVTTKNWNLKKYDPLHHLFCLTSLCDWSRKVTPISQPIRYKSKNHSRFGRFSSVFPRFRQFSCIYFLLIGCCNKKFSIFVFLTIRYRIEIREMVSFELGKEIERDVMSSCHERGTKKKFWVPMRNRTSDLRIPRSDALTTKPERLYGERGLLWSSYDTRPAYC